MISLRTRAFVPTLMLVGTVVAVISSLGAPLIPSVAHDLHTTLPSAQWMLTAPVLVAAVTSPLVGRLGDGRHRKRVILVCLSLVLLGGVLAALATSLAPLIAGRALQGLGLTVMPLTMAAAREVLPARRSPQVIATLSVIGAAGVGLGYPITGLIAQQSGVEAAFWFGVLFSAIALVLSIVAIPASRVTDDLPKLDFAGAAMIGAGLLALLLALEKGSDWGWGASSTIALLGAAIVLLPAWVLYELRVPSPLVDLRLVRHRAVLSADISALLVGVAMYTSVVVVSQIVQLHGIGFGASVFVAGFTLLPLSVASLVASMSLPAIERRMGPRAIIPVGALALAAACFFFAATTSALWQAFVAMGLLGLGVGYTFAAMPSLIVSSIPASETASAMSFYQVSRYVGFSIGSGLAASLIRAFGDSGEPSLSSYRITALVAGGLAVAAAAVAWLLLGKRAEQPLDADGERALEEGALGAAGLAMLETDEPRRPHATSRTSRPPTVASGSP